MAVSEVPTTQFVRVDTRDGVGFVTLDRPPLNVLTIAMMREIIESVERLGEDPSLRAIVLRGNGRAFSAGVDIGEHQGETLLPLLETFDALVLRLLNSPAPVISVVHGVAFGGGCELATASDLVLIAEDARIGVPEIRLAVYPPAAAVLFPRLIGTHRALEMILTGEPVNGVEAARIGLANRAVPADQLDAALEELLTRFRASSAYTLRLARQAVISSLNSEPAEALERLKQIQVSQLIPSHDAQEGLRAFLDKRLPRWEHR